MKKITLAVAIAAAIVVGPSFMALGQDQSARKLLVALWKYVTAGVVIEGAVMKRT